MKKNLLTLTCLVFALACAAQHDTSQLHDLSRPEGDSSRLDIGWLDLDKGLTQTVTVKGSDLEKMPFVNLSDAIAAWFHGGYSQPVMFAYVVDGNPVTHVNIYSIFDIDEVTLVEQAAGAAAYGGTQQELVLVTTKRGPGKQGLRFSGQAGFVNENGEDYKTFTRGYHHYYLGAYRNDARFSYGLSADWIRDMSPEDKKEQDHVSVPYQLQRWRFNGWIEWRPAKGQVVELRMSYSPQVIKGMLDSVTVSDERQVRLQDTAHVLIPELRWKATLVAGLTNDLQAVYMQTADNFSFIGESMPLSGGQNIPYGQLSVTRNKQLFLRDRLAYRISAGDWRFTPAVNFSYHHIDERNAQGTSRISIDSNNRLVYFPAVLGPTLDRQGNLFYLTPGIELGWRNAIDLQIGERVNASSYTGANVAKNFPYAALGVDALRFGHKVDGASLKLFWSAAQRMLEMVDDYSLMDFSGGGGNYSLDDINHLPQEPPFITAGPPPPLLDTFLVHITTPRTYWNWDAGISWSKADHRLEFQYHVTKRLFSTAGQIGSVGPTASSSFMTIPTWSSLQHHFDVRWKVVDHQDMHWLMDLNLSFLKFHDDNMGPPYGQFWANYFLDLPTAPQGDMSSAHLSWTGGFVNRWQVGNFTAGLDILYHFGESPLVFPGFGTQYTGPKLNSVQVSNIYAGYRWKIGAGTLELFAESRALIRSRHSDLLDERRYYTAGGNFTF